MSIGHARRQAAVFAELRREGRDATDASAGRAGLRPRTRLEVHRRNMTSSLVAALRRQFPVTSRLLGTHRFDAVAAAHVRRAPPRSPVLLAYGDGFGETIRSHPVAERLAFVADVADIELACARAYHAADLPALDRDGLRRLASEDAGALRFAWHPAAAVLTSRHPAPTIYLDHLHDGDPPARDLSRGEDCLVTRPRLAVEVRHLPAGGHAFFTALRRGLTLGEASARASDRSPGTDLGLLLALLLDTGAVVAPDASPST